MGGNPARKHKNIESHPDYAEEKKYLKDTIKAIEEEIELNRRKYDFNMGKSILCKKEHNRASSMDSIVTLALANINNKKKNRLEGSLDEPYFARVDFKEDSYDNGERLYFGKETLIDENGRLRVIHYNNPVAALYYEHSVGKAGYSAPDGIIEGNIFLRRQFIIQNHELINFYESRLKEELLKKIPKLNDNETVYENSEARQDIILDPLLQQDLEKSSDNKLNHIIETIQKEQYKIIRQPLNQVAIVQGSAGSGKSTVAMHRISYLCYNKLVSGEKIAIVAPNRMFLDYISTILPELDIEKINQFTIEGIGEKILEEKVEINVDEKLEYIMNADEGYLNHMISKLIVESSYFKSSLKFKKIIDVYLSKKSDTFILGFKNIELFNKQLTIKIEEQRAFWNKDFSPYNIKINNMKKFIEEKIDNYINKHSNYYNKSVVTLNREKDNFKTSYFLRWEKLNYKEIYLEIINNIDKLAAGLDIESLTLEVLRKQSLELINCGSFEREDIAPLCYIKAKLIGVPRNLRFDHIVVDEAQDLSFFEYSLLKELSNNKSFTIFGDLSQGINSYRGIRDWEELKKEIFDKISSNIFTLKESYRSTKEIVEIYNKVLPSSLPKGNPVYRTGEEPVMEQTISLDVAYERASTLLNYYQKIGCKSIAVITKNNKQSIKAYDRLALKYNNRQLQLLTSETSSFKSGVTVTSVSNSKGLEFDAVIILEADDFNYKADELHAKLLYIAMSRALHYLHVFYCGNKTSLLNK